MDYDAPIAREEARLQRMLEDEDERETAAAYAIEGLRIIANVAGTWADPDQTPRDAADVLRQVRDVAAETAARTRAMAAEERERRSGRR